MLECPLAVLQVRSNGSASLSVVVNTTGIQITIESADSISHSTVALVVNDVMVVVIDN